MRQWSAFGLVMQISGTLLFSLLIPLAGGIWLDRQLNTTPLFVLVGTALGILAATVGVVRMATRMFHEVEGESAAARGSEAKDEEDIG